MSLVEGCDVPRTDPNSPLKTVYILVYIQDYCLTDFRISCSHSEY